MTSGEDGASQSRGRRNPSLYIIDVIENLTKIKQKQLDRGFNCINSNAPLDQYLDKKEERGQK